VVVVVAACSMNQCAYCLLPSVSARARASAISVSGSGVSGSVNGAVNLHPHLI
jgi:hypothetical protein